MSLNYDLAIFIVSKKARCVACSYQPNEQKRTLFKTLDQSIKVDDYVVVPTNTRHGMTVTRVTETDIVPDVESTTPMNWIIGVVNVVDYESLQDQEREAVDIIKSAERARRAEELRETMVKAAESHGLKELPIFSDKDD